VSRLQSPNRKNLMLFSGRSYPELAVEVGAYLGVKPVATNAYEFANGEIFVRFEESVRGCDAFVIQSHASPVNEWVMEQLLMVDALKRASAKRITAVLPFYPYARQDKKHRGREPISARLIADLFLAAGAHRLMAVDLHTSQIQGFFDGPVDHLRGLTGHPVGTVGFCMGGALSLFAACTNPEAVAACVVYYGGHPKVTFDFDRLKAPLLGHWAERDDSTNANVPRIEAELGRRGKPYEFHTYPGTTHAFFNDDRPQVYHRESAERSWQRTVAFFTQHL